MSYIATRHNVGFGEGVKWTPPEGAASFFVWVKHSAVDSAMRWRRVAGWDVANNVVIPVAIPVGAAEFRLSRAEVVLNWEALLSLFDGYDPEIIQFTTHADDTADSSALRTRDVYLLPPPASTNAASIAALERRFLGQLLEMRAGLAPWPAGISRSRRRTEPRSSACPSRSSTAASPRSGRASRGSSKPRAGTHGHGRSSGRGHRRPAFAHPRLISRLTPPHAACPYYGTTCREG